MVETALQEDAEVLAISSLAGGASRDRSRDDIALLKERGAHDVRLVMGGIIPNRDRHALLEIGVCAPCLRPKIRILVKSCGGLSKYATMRRLDAAISKTARQWAHACRFVENAGTGKRGGRVGEKKL